MRSWPTTPESGALMCRRSGSVAILELNRPAQANALDEELLRALDDALTAVPADGSIAAVVLTGAGQRFFCAGGDLAMLGRWKQLSRYDRQELLMSGQQVVRRIIEMPVPVIAVVNGGAVGAGFDLALAADLCVASESAWFQAGFGAVGLVPDFGGSWLLPRAIGLSRARTLFYGNVRVDARTAQEWGLVSTTTGPTDLMTVALQAVADLAAATTRQGFAETKRAVYESYSMNFRSSLLQSASAQSQLIDTPEHEQRVNALLARPKEKETC